MTVILSEEWEEDDCIRCRGRGQRWCIEVIETLHTGFRCENPKCGWRYGTMPAERGFVSSEDLEEGEKIKWHLRVDELVRELRLISACQKIAQGAGLVEARV